LLCSRKLAKQAEFDRVQRAYLEARAAAVEQKLARNGIAPDGRPLDPRAVFFS